MNRQTGTSSSLSYTPHHLHVIDEEPPYVDDMPWGPVPPSPDKGPKPPSSPSESRSKRFSRLNRDALSIPELKVQLPYILWITVVLATVLMVFCNLTPLFSITTIYGESASQIRATNLTVFPGYVRASGGAVNGSQIVIPGRYDLLHFPDFSGVRDQVLGNIQVNATLETIQPLTALTKAVHWLVFIDTIVLGVAAVIWTLYIAFILFSSPEQCKPMHQARLLNQSLIGFYLGSSTLLACATAILTISYSGMVSRGVLTMAKSDTAQSWVSVPAKSWALVTSAALCMIFASAFWLLTAWARVRKASSENVAVFMGFDCAGLKAFLTNPQTQLLFVGIALMSAVPLWLFTTSFNSPTLASNKFAQMVVVVYRGPTQSGSLDQISTSNDVAGAVSAPIPFSYRSTSASWRELQADPLVTTELLQQIDRLMDSSRWINTGRILNWVTGAFLCAIALWNLVSFFLGRLFRKSYYLFLTLFSRTWSAKSETLEDHLRNEAHFYTRTNACMTLLSLICTFFFAMSTIISCFAWSDMAQAINTAEIRTRYMHNDDSSSVQLRAQLAYGPTMASVAVFIILVFTTGLAIVMSSIEVNPAHVHSFLRHHRLSIFTVLVGFAAAVLHILPLLPAFQGLQFVTVKFLSADRRIQLISPLGFNGLNIYLYQICPLSRYGIEISRCLDIASVLSQKPSSGWTLGDLLPYRDMQNGIMATLSTGTASRTGSLASFSVWYKVFLPIVAIWLFSQAVLLLVEGFATRPSDADVAKDEKNESGSKIEAQSTIDRHCLRYLCSGKSGGIFAKRKIMVSVTLGFLSAAVFIGALCNIMIISMVGKRLKTSIGNLSAEASPTTQFQANVEQHHTVQTIIIISSVLLMLGAVISLGHTLAVVSRLWKKWWVKDLNSVRTVVPDRVKEELDRVKEVRDRVGEITKSRETLTAFFRERRKKFLAKRSDVREPDKKNAGGQNPDGQNADGQNADGQNADGQNANVQNANVQNANGQSANGQNTDALNANVQNANIGPNKERRRVRNRVRKIPLSHEPSDQGSSSHEASSEAAPIEQAGDDEVPDNEALRNVEPEEIAFQGEASSNEAPVNGRSAIEGPANEATVNENSKNQASHNQTSNKQTSSKQATHNQTSNKRASQNHLSKDQASDDQNNKARIGLASDSQAPADSSKTASGRSNAVDDRTSLSVDDSLRSPSNPNGKRVSSVKSGIVPGEYRASKFTEVSL